MTYKHIRKFLLILLSFVTAFVVLLVVEGLVAARGPRITYYPPARTPLHLGHAGRPLVYVVMGDSTAAGQGTSRYDQGIAMLTAQHLALTHHITTVNLAVSGATTADVLRDQLSPAVQLRPDVVLISLGANDATHFTGTGTLSRQVNLLVETLLQARCETRIVLTGSPDLGGAHCFAQPLRWFAGTQSARINRSYLETCHRYQLTWAPIAAQTGMRFKQDPSLLAADHFHPNDRGYAIWMPILNNALDRALIQQPSHCRPDRSRN